MRLQNEPAAESESGKSTRYVAQLDRWTDKLPGFLREYNQLLESDPTRTAADMAVMVTHLERRGVHVNGNPALTFLKPDLITLAEHNRLRRVIPWVMSCLERAIGLFDEAPALHPLYNISDAIRPLVDIDPRVPGSAMVVARPDGFLNRGDLKFIEFNVDSPAGMGYADIFEELIVRSGTFRSFISNGYRAQRMHRRHHLLEALLDYYRRWCECTGQRDPAAPPTVAITDWSDAPTAPEFGILRGWFAQRGLECLVVDPREFAVTYGKRGDVLEARGKRIDLVYRRALVHELADRADDVEPLIDAARRGLVCIANPFRSRLASSKTLLQLLTDPELDSAFTRRQNRIRHSVLPWTHRLIDARVRRRGDTVDLVNLLRTRRDQFVIKPANGRSGQGVTIGAETDTAEWEAMIHRALLDGRFVVQEAVPIPLKRVPVAIEPGEASIDTSPGRYPEHDPEPLAAVGVRLSRRKCNLGPFAFGGFFGGAIARLSRDSIINVGQGGGVVPTMAIATADDGKS